MINLLDYSYEDLEILIENLRQPKYRINQLYDALQNYKDANSISNLPNDLIAILKKDFILISI